MGERSTLDKGNGISEDPEMQEDRPFKETEDGKENYSEIICFHSSVYPSSLIAETLFYHSKIESLYFRVCPFSAYYNEHLLTLLNILLK